MLQLCTDHQSQSVFDKRDLILSESAKKVRSLTGWVEVNWSSAVTMGFMRDQAVTESPNNVMLLAQCDVMLKVHVEGVDVVRKIEEVTVKTIVINL
jgi:hypothetical protein